jgi:hypothetical protein
MEPNGHNHADALASYFHEVINKVLRSDWVFLFKYSRTLNLNNLKNVEKAARELWEDTDYLAVQLTRPCPALEDLPRLRAQIRADYGRLELSQDWERYLCTVVLPRFQDREDFESFNESALYIRESIIGFHDSLRGILDSIKALLGEADKPCLYCNLETSQIREIYKRLADAGYIAEGTWEDFFRCFDYYTPAPGWIHWIKENTVKRKNTVKHDGKDISKRPIIFFLIYFNVPSTLWNLYATTLFHIELTYDDTHKVEKMMERKELPGRPFWDLDRIAKFDGKKYWEDAYRD